MRGVLSDGGSAALPVAMDGEPRSFWGTRGGMPEAGNGGGGTHGSSRGAPGDVPGASGLDRGGRGGEAAAAWVDAGVVAHVRAGASQFRIHDAGYEGDCGAVQGGRHLQQPVDRQRDVLLPALP